MRIINYIKRKYIVSQHKKRNKNLSFFNEVDLIKLRNEIMIIDNTIPLGTSSWENNRKELRENILNNDMSDFINWDIIQNTMFYEAPEIEYKSIIRNKLLLSSINESKIGNPKPYYLNNKTSGNLVHHAYSLLQIMEKCTLDCIDQVIEFGGGYGSMCRLFRNINFAKDYIIFDLPEFSALQEFYLTSVNEQYLKNTIFTSNMSILKERNKPNTLFMATWSFSEMPLDLREDLLSTLTFDFCVIAFQSKFDGIDNVEYFKKFKNRYENITFDIYPINHLEGHYYLIGKKASK